MISKENLINNLEMEEYLTQMQTFEIKMAGYFFLVLNKKRKLFLFSITWFSYSNFCYYINVTFYYLIMIAHINTFQFYCLFEE